MESKSAASSSGPPNSSTTHRNPSRSSGVHAECRSGGHEFFLTQAREGYNKSCHSLHHCSLIALISTLHGDSQHQRGNTRILKATSNARRGLGAQRSGFLQEGGQVKPEQCVILHARQQGRSLFFGTHLRGNQEQLKSVITDVFGEACLLSVRHIKYRGL